MLCMSKSKWRVAREQSDPDPAGRPVPTEWTNHAYDIEEHRGVHAITGSYSVREDEEWAAFGPGTRCKECVDIVGRRPND